MAKKLPQPILKDDSGNRVRRMKLLSYQSFMNCLPTILGFIMWSIIIVAGFNWLSAMRIYIDEVILSISIVVWMIGVAVPLLRIIPTPSLVYQEVYDE